MASLTEKQIDYLREVAVPGTVLPLTVLNLHRFGSVALEDFQAIPDNKAKVINWLEVSPARCRIVAWHILNHEETAKTINFIHLKSSLDSVLVAPATENAMIVSMSWIFASTHILWKDFQEINGLPIVEM